MKTIGFLLLCIIVLSVKAWPKVKKSFKVLPDSRSHSIHTISDCMHLTPEPGDYAVNREPQFDENKPLLEIVNTTVCGLYVIGAPDTIVEMTMKYCDVRCETGGLLRFFDGWELNGQFFPPAKEHSRLMQDRVIEFCNSDNNKYWPHAPIRRLLRSSQNAAMLQYRIPLQGSFTVNVRFHKITQPCNVLVQKIPAVYHMANFGQERNCTLSLLLPAAVALAHLKIGGQSKRQNVNYDCGMDKDRLEIGGSSGLEVTDMTKAADICGYSKKQIQEQAIFCGVTTVRLLSTGRYKNYAAVSLRKADNIDLDIAAVVCPI